MKTLALYILGTLALGISVAQAAFVPTVYDTNTDAVAQLFVRAQIGQQVGPSGSNFITGPVRPLLTNSFTLFVATTGSDSNPGTNSSSPLLTIQAAVNKAMLWDFSTNNITVQIANGSYSGSVLCQGQIAQTDWKNAGGVLILHGNDASPSSVIITNATTNHLILASQHTRLSVRSLTVGSTNVPNADLFDSQLYSTINVSNIVMGPCGVNACQVVSEIGGMFYASGTYTVTGGGLAHWLAHSGGSIWITAAITVSGTPTYTLAFVQAYSGGSILLVSGGSFSGSATGLKYQFSKGGSFTSFGGASADATFPGSINGIQDQQMAEGSSQPFTATNGVFGITNGSSAAPGVIGEFTNRFVTFAVATNMLNNTPTNITSITLSAGDWDVEGLISFTYTTATVGEALGGITTTSSTLPVDGSAVFSDSQLTLASSSDTLTIPRVRVSTTISTNVFLVGSVRFTAGTAVGYGTMSARRVR